MLPNKKVLFLVFIVTLIASASISILYIKESRRCVAQIKSLVSDLGIRVDNNEKWQGYINAIGNCKHGTFTVFTSLDKTPLQASRVTYIISDEVQSSSLTTKDKEVLYTFSYTYDRSRREASVILNFPEISNLDGARINSAILLTSYRLFTGEKYSRKDDRLINFNSLASMGLIYEKR